MKKWTTSFLGMCSRINFHLDGFSLQGGYSFRISHIPKNKVYAAQFLNNLCQKTPILLLITFMDLLSKVNAQETCDNNISAISFPQTLTNVYMKQLSNASFLLVQHNRDESFTALLNNTCGFFFTDRQPVLYNRLVCGPSDVMCFVDVTLHCLILPICRINLFGNNVAEESLRCLNSSLTNYCNINVTNSLEIGLLATVAVLSCFGVYCYLTRCQCQIRGSLERFQTRIREISERINRRRDERPIRFADIESASSSEMRPLLR